MISTFIPDSWGVGASSARAVASGTGPVARGPAMQHSPRKRSGATVVKERTSVVAVKERPKVEPPKMYKVIMLNDSYTPMEFVVVVLQQFFGMPQERAVKVMLTIHNEGQASVGIYSLDVAQTKIAQVTAFARKHQHPLRCAMEAA